MTNNGVSAQGWHIGASVFSSRSVECTTNKGSSSNSK